MAAPLDTIIAPDRRERPPMTVVRRWDLPETDRVALTRWGLPTDQIMTPAVQLETEPQLVPNVAGEYERRLISPDQRLYDLGRWGGHDLTPKIGAVAGDGRVLSIRATPLTAHDLHPQLREHHQGLYHPAVDFISSSVAQFVEVTWRWRAAIEVLRDLHEPHYTRPEEEFDAYIARLQACERIVLSRVEAIDPEVRADNSKALWVEVITDEGC